MTTRYSALGGGSSCSDGSNDTLMPLDPSAPWYRYSFDSGYMTHTHPDDVSGISSALMAYCGSEWCVRCCLQEDYLATRPVQYLACAHYRSAKDVQLGMGGDVKVKKLETPLQAANREMAEEYGVQFGNGVAPERYVQSLKCVDHDGKRHVYNMIIQASQLRPLGSRRSVGLGHQALSDEFQPKPTRRHKSIPCKVQLFIVGTMQDMRQLFCGVTCRLDGAQDTYSIDSVVFMPVADACAYMSMMRRGCGCTDIC